MTEERDAAVTRAENANADLREATRSWESAMRKVVEERDKVVAREQDALAMAGRAGTMAMDSLIIDGAMENALGKLAGMLGIDQSTIESPADIVEAALVELRELRMARVDVMDVAASVSRLGYALGIEKWNPTDADVDGMIDTAIRRMAALDRERLSARSEAGALKLSLAIIDERQRQREGVDVEARD
jgi:hypothetical protein